MKKLIERWKAATPKFWKKAIWVAVKIGSAAIALKAGNATFDLALPAIIITVCNYTIAACVTLGLTAKLTKEDK
jgi:NAD kinase